MATQIQWRKGTTAQHASFTGVLAEVTVDTDKKTAVIHDGATAGGFPLAKESQLDTKQPLDATLTSLASLGTAADKIAYTTALDTWAETPITAAARTVIDDTTVEAMRTTLGAAVSGVNSDITSLSAVTTLSNAAGVAIIGTNTNNSAAAGYIGEFVSSTLTSVTPVSLTNLTIADVTSISLTAGDWDVDGQVSYAFGATTSVTRLRQGASSASATMTNGLDMSVQTTAAQVPTDAIDANLPIPKTRFSLNATTTIYLVAQAEFTVSTCAAYGTIRARRVR